MWLALIVTLFCGIVLGWIARGGRDTVDRILARADGIRAEEAWREAVAALPKYPATPDW